MAGAWSLPVASPSQSCVPPTGVAPGSLVPVAWDLRPWQELVELLNMNVNHRFKAGGVPWSHGHVRECVEPQRGLMLWPRRLDAR
jgi:hypothetical protein